MKAFVGYLLILSFVLYNVNCVKVDKTPECEKHGVYSACPDDCTKYNMCFQGRLLKFRCHWGLHWNEKHNKCDSPKDANCDKSLAVEPAEPDVSETTPPLEPKDSSKEKIKVVCYCK